MTPCRACREDGEVIDSHVRSEDEELQSEQPPICSLLFRYFGSPPADEPQCSLGDTIEFEGYFHRTATYDPSENTALSINAAGNVWT